MVDFSPAEAIFSPEELQKRHPDPTPISGEAPVTPPSKRRRQEMVIEEWERFAMGKEDARKRELQKKEDDAIRELLDP